MDLLQRPKPGETEEDLINQCENFQKNLDKNISPAAKVVKIGKRKTESNTAVIDSGHHTETEASQNNERRKSKFSESRSKKKKDGYVDYSVLDAAEIKKDSVLKTIVERDVPALSPILAHWKPMPSPHGNPVPPKLDLQFLQNSKSTTEVKGESKFPRKKKSLYMQQIEMELAQTRKEFERKVIVQENTENEHLKLLGSESYILDGRSGLGKTEEAASIHNENMSKLSAMTHEERLQEREELLSKLSEEQINFIISLRQKKKQPKEETEMMQTDEIIRQKKKQPKEETEMMQTDEIMKEEKLETQQPQSLDEYTSRVNEGVPQKIQEKEENNDKFGEMGKEIEEQVNLSELPIPPGEAKNWCHMDKVEIDKLKWMTNVPQPKPLRGKTGYVARFNFEGDLLPYDADISWREGLHHHGEEPGRAGYSLDELFLFVRSQVLQQRHLGLKTLGNILRNASEGLYDSCFDTPIVQLMVDAGVVLLLRFALDETSALVYAEALRALYYLIGCEPDEKCLSIAEPWTPMGVQPGFSSLTYSRERDREELNKEEEELKDVEVIKLDVIRALVRMDVHIRLRYLFESINLAPPDVYHSLGILRRIARHSLTAAWTLMKTPRLIETIVLHFLPYNTNVFFTGKRVDQLTSVYGIPLSQALNLLKVLASRGRHIASTLLEKHALMDRLMAYATMEPTEVELPITEVLTLSQETFNIWSIFLSYSHTKAQQGFINFYPLFIKQLFFYRDKLDINCNVDSNHYNYEIGSHLANVLTKGLCVAATESLLTSRTKNNEPSISSNDGRELVLRPPILEWKNFEDIFKQVEICLIKWLSQLSDISEVSFSGFKLLGSFCSFISVYIENWRGQKNFDGNAFIKKIDDMLPRLISPIQNETVLQFLLKGIRNNSSLCSSLELGTCRDVPNLGSLGSVCKDGKVIPILQKDSPFSFIFPYTKLLKTLCTVPSNKSNFSPFLCNSYLRTYFNAVCNSNHSISSQWFSRIEIYTIVNILQLAHLKTCNDPNLFHRTALTIFPLVHKGDEHIIKSLLVDIICNPKFLGDILTIEIHINALSLKSYKPLKSLSVQQPTVSSSELTKRVLDTLPSIGQNYIKNILHSRLLEKSSVIHRCIPFLINDLTINREEFLTVVDQYWSLAALKMLQLLSDAKSEETNQSQPETITSATNWLQMTFFLLKYKKSVLATHTNPTGWIRHLSLVFLALNDLFLDVNVCSYVQASVIATLENEGYEKLDPLWNTPDLQQGLNWYNKMIGQFTNLSYGDSTFALFIIIPLLRNWPTSYKLALFGDGSLALRFIKLSTEDVSQFIPIEKFLQPTEDDENLIQLYKSASKAFVGLKNSFLYEFTNHHILEYNKKFESVP